MEEKNYSFEFSLDGLTSRETRNESENENLLMNDCFPDYLVAVYWLRLIAAINTLSLSRWSCDIECKQNRMKHERQDNDSQRKRCALNIFFPNKLMHSKYP